MTIINKTAKLASGLVLALSLAAPLALSATPAAAASYHDDRGDGNNNRDNGYGRDNDRNDSRYGYDQRDYRDRDHRPPMKFERMSYRPHHGWNYHRGHWAWGRDHWMWIGGDWSSR